MRLPNIYTPKEVLVTGLVVGVAGAAGGYAVNEGTDIPLTPSSQEGQTHNKIVEACATQLGSQDVEVNFVRGACGQYAGSFVHKVTSIDLYGPPKDGEEDSSSADNGPLLSSTRHTTTILPRAQSFLRTNLITAASTSHEQSLKQGQDWLFAGGGFVMGFALGVVGGAALSMRQDSSRGQPRKAAA